MTIKALPDSRTSADVRAVELFAALPNGQRQTPGTVAAVLDTMEIMSSAHFRTAAVAAVNAERLATAMSRQDLCMRARLVQADAMLREGRTPEAGRIAHEVLAWATAAGDGYVRARAHYTLCHFFRHIGDLDDGLAHAVQCVSQLPDDTPAAVRARHGCALAVALDETGAQVEGQRRFRESLDIAVATGDDELAMLILNNMAYTAYEQGDEAAAADLSERMRVLLARGTVILRSFYLDTRARIEMMRGRYEEAERILAPILDGSGEHLLTEGTSLAECLLTAAESQRARGDLELAQQTLTHAAEVADSRGLASHRARIRQAQADLYAATGRFQEAYEEHVRFFAESQALQSEQREARARALQTAFQIDEARRNSEHFREMAHRDPLTGLHNRRLVNERLPLLLREAADHGKPLSVALLDLDHFKRINDTLSHEAGDAVLQQVGAILAEHGAEPFAAARMGGEEFLLILPGIGPDEALRRCEQVRLAIRSHPWAPVTGELPVTTSVGVTTVQRSEITPSALLAQADRNLYAAKRAGRDRVVADPR